MSNIFTVYFCPDDLLLPSSSSRQNEIAWTSTVPQVSLGKVLKKGQQDTSQGMKNIAGKHIRLGPKSGYKKVLALEEVYLALSRDGISFNS